MDFKTQIISSQSSFNYVNRFLIARPEPVDAPKSVPKFEKLFRRVQGILGVILFVAIFFGILSAIGLGLSELSNRSSLSQAVSSYVKRLS
ncbi:MAG: hypothetical protein EBU88_14550 [Acidobacteria bacterium]|nr:hypothetical protein [Acidobacteriota bacterium]